MPSTRQKLHRPLPRAIEDRHTALLALLENAAALGVDAVHDIRVSLRRLEEAARLLPDDPGKSLIKPAFRKVRRACGDIRDADVMADHLRAAPMPPSLTRRAHALAVRLKAQRPALAAKLRQLLAAKSFATALSLLLPATLEYARYAEKSLQRRAKKRRKSLRHALQLAADKQTPDALHAARIAAKKLRYLLELAADTGDKNARKEAKSLKHLQKIAGQHHDTHVLLARLHKSTDEAAESPSVAKWNHQQQRAQTQRAAAFFAAALAWEETFT
ncbi:MAG TPA: CHAD domain-containing protein [Phycisphaerae bacterium]|nr:CHAD domain-containing protein [Phycisphaerae bacterium]